MAQTVTDIADEIFFELGEPSNTSVAAIAFWLRSNIGALNSSLSKSYVVNSTSPFDISPEIGDSEKYIYKIMYFIQYETKLINDNLGAAAYTAVLEYTSDGDTIRKVNKNEVAKTHLQLRKQLQEDLKDATSFYKKNGFVPLQVFGDDIFTPESPRPRIGISRNGLTQNDY